MEKELLVKGATSWYRDKLVSALGLLDEQAVDKGVAMIETAWRAGKQIIVFGNGGSAITALHYITDWNKMIPLATGRAFFGRTLLDNIGLLTAYSNDMCYEDVFSGQLSNILQEGDLVIAISGSGNSENVIRALNYAHLNHAVSLGLCGYDGGQVKKIVQHAIHVPINDMQVVEDVHAVFCHIVMQTLCGYFHKSLLKNHKYRMNEERCVVL